MFGGRRPVPNSQPPPQQPSRNSYNRIPPDSSDRYGGGSPSYGRGPSQNERHQYDGAPSEKHDYSRGQPRQGHGGQTWQLQPQKSPNPQFTYSNIVAVSPFDFPPSRDAPADFYLQLNDMFVCTARRKDDFPQGQLGLSDFQRSWAAISFQDRVTARIYNPFEEVGHRYLGSLDADLSFAGKKETEQPFDQDELQALFTAASSCQCLVPGLG